MKIITWNVNSIRARQDHVRRLLFKKKPSILCLQEIKVNTLEFPYNSFPDYHNFVSGEIRYNGVSIHTVGKSITGFNVERDPFNTNLGKRVISLTFRGLRIINVYVPNGGKDEQAYLDKLVWLSSFLEYIQEQKKIYKNVIVVGDFNICPTDRDVYNPKAWKNSVTCTEPERKFYTTFCECGFIDAFRHVNNSEGQYTWWDYRSNGFSRGNGLRIDHILVSDNLVEDIKRCQILRFYRGLKIPSDHAPLMLELKKNLEV